MIRLIAVGLAFGVVACDPAPGDEPEELVPAESPAEPVEDEEPEDDADDDAEDEAPALPPVTTAQPGDAEGTSCERAFAAVADFRAQFEALGSENEAPPLDRPEYIERCETLSVGAQECMILSYAITHQEDCAQFQPEIDAASVSN